MTAYDFSHEAARDRQFTIVREVCEGFDVDGFEMDYFRHPMFFSRCMRGEPATPEETAIMTGFMTRIRKMADAAAARRGRPLLLSARVPDTFEQAIHLGMDVEGWMANDLVDLIIAGGGYASSTLDVERFVRTAHEHDVRVYPCINQKPWSCDPAWCREGNRALAARWHRAGADGIHFWNLATPFDPYSVDTPEELAAVRNRVYACLNDVGEAGTLEGTDKLYCVDSSVFVHYRHVTEEPPLPLHLTPGRRAGFPLPLGDDVQAAAKDGTLQELRLELTVHGHLQEGGLELTVNGQSTGAGDAVRIGYAHSHEHRHEADGYVSPHSHYLSPGLPGLEHRVTYLLDAPPMAEDLGKTTTWNCWLRPAAIHSRRGHLGGPLQLVNAQLWVRFSNSTSVHSRSRLEKWMSIALPQWLEDLRHAEVVRRVGDDSRSVGDSLLGVSFEVARIEVVERGQANFDKPWGDLTPDDRVLLYAYCNQKGHLVRNLRRRFACCSPIGPWTNPSSSTWGAARVQADSPSPARLEISRVSTTSAWTGPAQCANSANDWPALQPR